ncbi:hypothetical protein RF55_25518 [Lasius niger]|uniref:Uncharacterized protein n=1 Tax=Lasius niger TaxID=67767 RepID=A0A0J7MM85_LASNI|nr:hypothetical protein RF55_25518 [Lasius niger]
MDPGVVSAARRRMSEHKGTYAMPNQSVLYAQAQACRMEATPVTQARVVKHLLSVESSLSLAPRPRRRPILRSAVAASRSDMAPPGWLSEFGRALECRRCHCGRGART